MLVSVGERYNDARKITYIPFPYPHAQITVIFVSVIVWIFPLLYFSYVNSLFLACVFDFVTVLCFVGIYEVARELENPFTSIPNNLPLTTFQAQFNEALLVTCSGFHPDFWHELPKEASLDEKRMYQRPLKKR